MLKIRVVRFSVPDQDLLTAVTAISTPAAVTPARSANGAFMDYALSLRPPAGSGADHTPLTVSANLTGVAFSRYGFLTMSSLVQLPQPRGNNQAVFTRLGTTYEFDQPGIPRAWTAGDLISPAPGWGREEFMGGIQLATDYSLQPNAITFPTPVIGQTLAQPSALSLLVNNVIAYNANAKAGPFALVGIPVLNGLNQITVQTRTNAGDVISQTVPFYASSTMLKQGLTEYDLSAGFIRHNYAQLDNFYATPSFIGTISRGLTNDFTATLHTETAPNLALLGAGGEASGIWGDLSAAMAVSTHAQYHGFPRQSGQLYSLQYMRSTPAFGISAGIIKTTSGYDDLGLETDQSYPVLSWHASGSAALPGNAGNIALAYTEESVRAHNRDDFLLASYSGQITSRLTFTLSCFRSIVRGLGVTTPNQGCNAGISLALGHYGTSGITSAVGHGQAPEWGETYADFPSSFQGPSISASNVSGDYTSRNLRLQDIDQYADIAVNIAQNGPAHAAEFDLSGSLIAMDGLYFSRPTNDSFAVADFSFPKVPVSLSNQPIGQTNHAGRLLIPDLVPNYPNKISIDPTALPISVSFSDDEITVTPPRKGGVLVRFPLQRLDAELLHIMLGAGGSPPAGSLFYLANTTTPVVIGYDGYVYLQHPPWHLRANVIMVSSHCTIDVMFRPSIHDALVGRSVACKD